MKIAITGGIGSGKSYVCKCLAKRGIKVYDCDAAAKRLMRSPDIKEQLCALVGNDLYRDGLLVKSVMSRFLLASEENARAVNDIVHPAVAHDFEESGYDWMECAIFFGSGFNHRVKIDKVICVTAPIDVRISRVMGRDGISYEKTAEWIRSQQPQEEILRLSDYEIVNDRIHDIDKQLDAILEALRIAVPCTAE